MPASPRQQALNARAAQVALRLTNAGSRLRPALLTARLERSSERLAGASARFFMSGRSDWLIHFLK